MNKHSNNSKRTGLTLLEIVLVLALISLSLSLSIIFVRRTQINADINAQTENLVYHLRLAQSNAISGVNNSPHGVHIESTKFSVFEGATYNEENEQNFTIELPASYSIQNINLQNAGSDIVFTAPNGETEDYGDFTLTATNIDEENTITITEKGTISY